MPIYEFICDQNGEILERFYKMGSAPETFDREGYRFRRNWGSIQGVSEQVATAQKYPYASNRLPRNMKGCPVTKEGKPIITSQTHEREIMARHNLERE